MTYDKQTMYKSVAAFFSVATAILVILYWPILWPVLWKTVLVFSTFALVMLAIGAILARLSEKHCPNDGRVMEYDSYGGHECPMCGRYEKNGNVLQDGKWLEPPYVIDKKDVWFEKEIDIIGEGPGELQGTYLCKLRDCGSRYYRYLTDKQLR